ncbi:MAG: U32 family peptidase [Lachnospiraceae bacterium]
MDQSRDKKKNRTNKTNNELNGNMNWNNSRKNSDLERNMVQNTVELLAPAGDYSTAIAALNAGADAVYLGAPSFSARAFAKNLSLEEIIQVIRYAHLWEKKIYLAINILIKNGEFQSAIRTISSLYEAGLDGVIVQDLGLVHVIPDLFPEMEMHISTQMAVLSEGGIEFCKEKKAVRVVPGRELSVPEIKEMKKTGISLECFIHGAMCYSYSGRCLMSSLAGGRSGNRGRCAGPCRKAYFFEEDNEKRYYISMKDMCALPVLDQLLEAGVDSLKIEGRMKNAEYAAGVSHIYRKYLDRKENVAAEDMEFLRNLYIRTDIREGYYNRGKGKELITLHNPSYRSMSSDLQEERENELQPFLSGMRSKPISIVVSVFADTKSSISITYDQYTINYEGAVAEKATNKPITKEEIGKRMAKLGDTMFYADRIEVFTDEASFLPVSALNELRRNAISKLEEEIFDNRYLSGRNDLHIRENWFTYFKKEHSRKDNFEIEHSRKDNLEKENSLKVDSAKQSVIWKASVKTLSQLSAVVQSGIRDIILDWDFFSKEKSNAISTLCNLKEKDKMRDGEGGFRFYLRLPEIIRQQHYRFIVQKTQEMLQIGLFAGVYCTCIDALGICNKLLGHTMLTKDMIYGDHGILIFNIVSEEAMLDYITAYTASFELNAKELHHFSHKDRREIVVYGYQDVMHSANCVLLTAKHCDKDKVSTCITDENKRTFPVYLHHDLCYNTIYNYLPLSLHQQLETLKLRDEAYAFRLQFTLEDEKQCQKILSFYKNADNGNLEEADFLYTTGHSKRGVE